MTVKLPQKAGFVATPDEWDALVRIAENLAAQVVQRDAALREMQAERDAARAEVARLTELLSEAVTGAGYAVTFGTMVSKGETIDNCGDPDAVLYLLGEAQSIETRLRAALRQPAPAKE